MRTSIFTLKSIVPTPRNEYTEKTPPEKEEIARQAATQSVMSCCFYTMYSTSISFHLDYNNNRICTLIKVYTNCLTHL